MPEGILEQAPHLTNLIEKENAEMLADRICELLRDPKRAHELGANGRTRAVTMFSRDRMARETVEAYEAAIQQHRRAPVRRSRRPVQRERVTAASI